MQRTRAVGFVRVVCTVLLFLSFPVSLNPKGRTLSKASRTLPNKMQCLPLPPKERHSNPTASGAPVVKGPGAPWSHPLRLPCSPGRDSGTMMSSAGLAAWSTAQESPTVGCSLMATQQVGTPSPPLWVDCV